MNIPHDYSAPDPDDFAVPPADDPSPFDALDDVPQSEDEPYPNSDIDSRKITLTFIADEFGKSLRRVDMTLPQLAEHIRFQTAASKMTLPWLKLALFGSKASEKGCLRTNENVLQITGIEVEHDLGEISFGVALATILKARIRALLYTSPSYVPGEKERWRILVPLSQNREPEVREKFVARINGLFSGKLARESFTLSLSYLYGHVDGREHRVEVIDGDFLDRRDDLYAGSIFRDGSKVGDKTGNGAASGDCRQSRKRTSDDAEPPDLGKIEAALDVVSSDCSYATWLKVAAALHDALDEDGFELFDQWSARATGTVIENGKEEARYTPEKSRKRWNGARTMTDVTIASLFYLADEADAGWRQRHDDEERQRIFERMTNMHRASTGDDAGDDQEPSDNDQGAQQATSQSSKGKSNAATSSGPLAPAYSEEFLALVFIAHHEADLRFVAKWGQWFRWDGSRWELEETLHAFDMARLICREAANACNKSSTAKTLASAKTVAAVERLAKADRKIAATFEQWDTDPNKFNASEED